MSLLLATTSNITNEEMVGQESEIGTLIRIARSGQVQKDYQYRPDVKGCISLRSGNWVVLSDERPQSPLHIDMAITLQCLAGCPYCYMNASASGRHALVENIVRFLDSFRYSPMLVTLGGGEPTLHPALLEIIQEIVKRDIVPTLTAGPAMNEQGLRAVLDYVPRIGISVNPADPEDTVEKLIRYGHKAVLHIPMFPSAMKSAIEVLFQVALRGVPLAGILALAPNPAGRASGMSVSYPFIARSILLLWRFAAWYNIPFAGNPCWVNNNVARTPEFHLVDVGCSGGQYGMHYNAVTNTCSRCSFVASEESPLSPQDWWDKQGPITECKYELPLLFSSPLLANLDSLVSQISSIAGE